MRYLIAATLFLLTAACYDPSWWHHYYPRQVDDYTPGGIGVTTNGNKVDLELIDTIVAETAECFGVSVAELPPFEVLIPPPVTDHDVEEPRGWYVSPCSGKQRFYCGQYGEGDPDLCARRCAGYADFRDPSIPGQMAVTPNLHALTHELVHLFTRDWRHEDPLFSKCEHISAAQ